MKKKFKMHHLLILVFLVFLSGMIISGTVKYLGVEFNRLKSEVTEKQLVKKVEGGALGFAQTAGYDLPLKSIKEADFYFFKNKRQLTVVLMSKRKEVFFETNFKNLSPGYGLRYKTTDLTPSEGIYKVDYAGLNPKAGLFVRVLYPPESYKDYQRIEFEPLKLEPYLISEKPFTQSFIQVGKEALELMIFLSTQRGTSVRLLVYPDKPPLTMELGGTEFTSEIYVKLEDEYYKMKARSDETKEDQ